MFLSKKGIQIKLIEKLNKKKINCSVGACPEIYKETIFKKLNIYPKNKLINAKNLGESSLAFSINPFQSLAKIQGEISIINKTLKDFV